MPAALFSGRSRRLATGSALVIVLFFIVLLSIVAIAFLSRSLTAIKVSAGSSGETKSKILAASASDTLIGDLKQEIIAGSGANSGSAAFPVYLPTSNLTMIPFMNGVPTAGSPATNEIPNMISRSVSPANTNGAAPYVGYTNTLYSSSLVPANRAASDSSANTTTYSSSKVNSATPSLNGRYVSPAQWNEHYLIPRATVGSGTISTPMTSFVPPDWVVVTRGGISSVTWSSGTGGLNDPTLTNTKYAVGRYAYAVYNEGGLLDMNAAGYPGTDTTSGSVGLTNAQSSYKSSLALADLTQLSVTTSGGTTTNMTQAQVNNIVGWRNYASAEPPALTGNFGSFVFSQTNSANWMTNFVQGNGYYTNGYMQVVPTPVTTQPTDQTFLSRQQLISLVESLGIYPDFLQYMGTFTRGLEQPSFVPDPNRPEIVQTGGAPPAYGSASSYTGNNDGEGGDTSINPSFLSIRVTSSTGFTRLNGTTAIYGEPLVKTKFPLQYLTWITYAGPSALRSAVIGNNPSSTPGNADYDIYQLENNYGISNALLLQGTTANLYAYFGLAYSGSGNAWTYTHGQNYIMTLSQVAAANREPDFAELLKAAICAGALGKAGPDLANNAYNYQYTVDYRLDLAVLQIMANLIDQSTADSFPTAITLGNSSNTVYGVKDLPYFYRFHHMSVVTQPPVPAFTKGSQVTFATPPAGTTTTGSLSGITPSAVSLTGSTTPSGWTCNFSFTSSGTTYTEPVTINSMANTTKVGTLSNTGTVALMYVPDLWNPQDANTLNSSAGLRPTKFQIYATTWDPLSGTGTWTIGAESTFGGSNNTVPTGSNTPSSTVTGLLPETAGTGTYNWRIAPTQTWSPVTTAMTFTDNNGQLFREPMLLWNNTNPNLKLTAATSSATLVGPVKDYNTSQSYYGFVLGQAPISLQVTYASTPTAQSTDGTYIVQGSTINDLFSNPSGSYPQISFFLQYLTPTGTWQTYDVKYSDLHNLAPPSIIADKTDDYSSTYGNPQADGQFNTSNTSVFDPRTPRWGVGTSSYLGEVSTGTFGAQTASSAFVLEPNANTDFNNNSLASTGFSVLETNRPRADKGDQVNYSNPGMVNSPGQNSTMRLYSGVGFGASNGDPGDPLEFDGLMTQNNSALAYNSKGSPSVTPTPGQHFYFEDPDGVDRRAMGAYADTTMIDDGSTANTSTYQPSTKRIGLPEATADTLDNTADPTPTSQSQSRPLILNRPFRNVGEMSYAFTGIPWRNIDFFTPESGFSALLDTFCITPPPPSALVAGKVDLNTRNNNVLQALVSGAYVDEVANSTSAPPTYALPPLTSTEAANVAGKLIGITTDTTHPWRGPLPNVSSLVGRYIANPGTSTNGFTDLYTYSSPSPPTSVNGNTLNGMTYAGLSAALDSTVYANASTPLIQRFRESAIRPLAASGQVRVWNLLLDIVAQSGHYPKSATGLDQFVVDGQTHLWVHVALDRLTGQVLDKQVEVVTP